MRPLCVSETQVVDELGATGEYSSMAYYVANLGDDEARARIIGRAINGAQSHIEMRAGMYLFHTRIVTRPVTTGLVRGDDYEVEEDGYPYTRNDFKKFGTVYLRRRPVVSIQRAGLRYGNSNTRIAAGDWPDGWINAQCKLGVLHILPILGSGGSLTGGSMLLLPLMASAMPGSISVPLIFSVDYTAGFLPRDYDPDGEDDPATVCPDFDVTPLVDAVRYMACANLLGIMGRIIAPGGGSIGMDGFSQSWQGNRFAAEIEDYKAQAEEKISLMESQMPVPVFAL